MLFSTNPPSLKGAAELLNLLCRLCPFALVFLGPPCSSFVWLSRSVSKRSRSTPCGDEQQAFVALGNAVARVVSNVIKWCNDHHVLWIIEQPASSLFWQHPDIARALETSSSHVYTVSFHMSAFGASTAKPTKLMGSAPWLLHLKAQRQSHGRSLGTLAVRTEKHVTGKKKALLRSASYPPHFCRAVALCHSSWHLKLQLRLSSLKKLCQQKGISREVCFMILAFAAEP